MAILSVFLCVCLCITRMLCIKMAAWIELIFPCRFPSTYASSPNISVEWPKLMMSSFVHTHTQHTTVLLLVWNMSGSTRVSRHQRGKTKKVKTNLDLLEQEIVRGNGICWAICKSAPHADNHASIPPLSFLQAGCPS